MNSKCAFSYITSPAEGHPNDTEGALKTRDDAAATEAVEAWTMIARIPAMSDIGDQPPGLYEYRPIDRPSRLRCLLVQPDLPPLVDSAIFRRRFSMMRCQRCNQVIAVLDA
jgi:hypothetical protein